VHSAAYYKHDRFKENKKNKKKKKKKKAAAERWKRMYTTHTWYFYKLPEWAEVKTIDLGIKIRGKGVTVNCADKALYRRPTRK